jgi:cob(I)alamin adenosyltransferase
MSKRLSKIYTRTGDTGSTGLGDGSRVDKDSLRVIAMGDVDELNACIGLLRTEAISEHLQLCLGAIQHDLFDLGAEICIPGHQVIVAQRIQFLENTLDKLNETLPALEEFILPGGARASAVCHLARTVCRRAERALVKLSHEGGVTEFALKYLNRLSDLLFVMCRIINREANIDDVLWHNKQQRAD